MIKEQKGITMLTLAITIIVIIIIAGVTFSLSRGLIKESELKTDITNMLLIQARADVIYDKNQFDDTVNLVGTTVTDEMINKYGIEAEKWYVWSNKETTEEGKISAKDELNNLNISIEDDEFYIVNYETSEVIYSEGYTDLDKNTVYKLSEMQNISKNK